ncbi:MAG: glycosyltransferase family 4 protein, partial [Gemmatimonadales bacterium]
DIEVRVVAPSGTGLSQTDAIQGIPIRRFRYAPRSRETLAYRGTMADDVSRSLVGKFALGSFLVAETAVLRSETSKWKPDVIHAHWWFPNGVAAATVSRLSRVPLVTTSHGTDLRLLREHAGARSLARYVLQRSARVTCVSQWLADQAAPLSASAPIVAPMPVAASLFAPSSDRDTNRIVFVGRLSAQKGIEFAIRALALMRRSIVLDVIGDGPDRAALTELATTLGLSERVLWRGNVRHDEVPALLARASALVAPFTDEGLGLVAVEAQLCGTPPVGFASGGLVDVIQDDVTGILVPLGDTAALATSLERIVTDPTLRVRLGTAGRASALERYTPDAVATQYVRIYEDAVSGRAGDDAQ